MLNKAQEEIEWDTDCKGLPEHLSPSEASVLFTVCTT